LGALHSQNSHSTPPLESILFGRAPLHKSQRFNSLYSTGPTSNRQPSSAHLTSLTSMRVPLLSSTSLSSVSVPPPSSRVCPEGPPPACALGRAEATTGAHRGDGEKAQGRGRERRRGPRTGLGELGARRRGWERSAVDARVARRWAAGGPR